MSDRLDGNPPETKPVTLSWVERIAAERGQSPAQPLPDWRTRLLQERENAKPPTGPSRERWLPQEQNPDLARQYALPPVPSTAPPRQPDRGREH